MLPIMVALGIGIGLGLVWWQLAGRAQAGVEFMHCWCEECGQKVRYSAEKAGRPGGCPRCKHRWILPLEPQPLTTDTPRVRVGAVRQRQAG